MPKFILMIEDNKDDALLIRRRLNEHLGRAFNVMHFDCMTKAGSFIEENKSEIEIILLDLHLPDTNDPEDTFNRIKKHCADIPVIVLTGVDDHQLAVKMIKTGAENFANKSLLNENPELLRDMVDFAISRHKSVADANQKAKEAIAEKDQVISWMSGNYSIPK